MRDVALKVCDGQGRVGLEVVGLPCRADPDLPPSFQAKAAGIQGNLSGDLLQSGGLLVVTKGGLGKGCQRPMPGCMGGRGHILGWEGLAELGGMSRPSLPPFLWLPDLVKSSLCWVGCGQDGSLVRVTRWNLGQRGVSPSSQHAGAS